MTCSFESQNDRMAESVRRENQEFADECPTLPSQASAPTNSIDEADSIDIKQDEEGRNFIEVSCGDISGVLYFERLRKQTGGKGLDKCICTVGK